MSNTKSDKIEKLKKHLANLKNRLGTVPERRKGQEKAYEEWLELEIRRTIRKIDGDN